MFHSAVRHPTRKVPSKAAMTFGRIRHLLNTGQPAEGLHLCKIALDGKGSKRAKAPYYHLSARCLSAMGERQMALDFHALAVQGAPQKPEYFKYLGHDFIALELFADASECFAAARALDPGNLGYVLTQAKCQYTLSDPGCLDTIETVLSQDPTNVEAVRLKEAALRSAGRGPEADTVLQEAMDLDPTHAMTLYAGARRGSATVAEKAESLIDAALISAKGRDRAALHFARAERHHHKGAFEAAYQCYLSGNAINLVKSDYDAALNQRTVDEIKSLFSRPVASAPGQAEGSPVPIFVVGMPRCGSTLTENILSAHSAVTPLGESSELTNAVRRQSGLSAGSQVEALTYLQQGYLGSPPLGRVTTGFAVDKYLANFLWIGHIVHAFPEARIVHVHRDPKAVAWSNFKQAFSGKSVGFSNSPDTIVEFHALYRDMMGFWTDRFGDRIVHLDYDRLVVDPEPQIRTLIDRLILPWEDACLAPEKVSRMVTTASKGQVTKAIYEGSSEAWRKYEPYAGDWLSRLPEKSDPATWSM